MLLVFVYLLSSFLVGSCHCDQPLTLKSTLTSPALDLKCTLHNAHAVNISHIISLVISKSLANQDEVLASAVSVGGANPVTHHLNDATVTSDLTWDGNSDSFLTIHWKSATRALNGNYTCTMNGLNHDNLPVSLVSMITVVLDDTDPTLVASPPVIEVGLTDSLTINCSLLGPSSLHLTKVMLIELSYLHGGIEQVLASVTPVSGSESKHGSEVDHVTGFLGNQNLGNYLEATWMFPDEDSTGQYICNVLGVNSSGLPVRFRRTVNVTAKNPPREDLINKITMIQSQYTKAAQDKQILEQRNTLKMEELQNLNATAAQRIIGLEERYESVLKNITFLEELYHNATSSTAEIIKSMTERNCRMN